MERLGDIILLLLSGGLVGIIPIVMRFIKQLRDGTLAKEETALGRWKELATKAQADVDRERAITSMFRRWYPRLWAAYVTSTGDVHSFPADPLDDNHEEQKNTDWKHSNQEKEKEIERRKRRDRDQRSDGE